MTRLNLNPDWDLRWEELEWGPEKSPMVLGKTDGWLKTDLPCDIHMPLLAAGIIKEPLEAENSEECAWTEEKSWWFRKIFDVDENFLAGHVIDLTFESLDANADVFLNGMHLGNQKSVHHPFARDVKRYLRSGENVILVRLTSGLECYSEQDIAAVKKYVNTEGERDYFDRGDPRRSFVRKPQYAVGWDWGPRLVTCGIVKDVWLESHTDVAIRSTHIVTRSISPNAELEFAVETENFNPLATVEGVLKLEMLWDGSVVLQKEQEVFLRSGLNFIRFAAEVPDAKLWWPSGMGEQNLYTVRVSVSTNHTCAVYPEFKYGIRQINLNLEKLNEKERKFAFEVNGIGIFCKGSNWIPADMIYARVNNEKYQTLLREAKEAHFNMMRIWGGAVYERDIFYELCDEYGILIWHDFMFACALYPDYLDWFRQAVEAEMDYQTRRLRNHACMALWCGGNENHWGFDEWWDATTFYGAECYNRIAPKIVERNCPEIPYWNSSPYGGPHPNGNEAGDKHHWHECLMSSVMAHRIDPERYDDVGAKFVSEYGYIGPCCKSSVIRYHGGVPIDRNSSTWRHHNNTFERGTVAAGIEKHYLDAENLSLDEYLLYGGVCHGMMLGYSLEAMRFKADCGGSLFWMFDDCWGETGWTVIDYYLKRKPGYYFVKRAFESVQLIIRKERDMVRVVGINETNQTVQFKAEYGYISFDGSTRESSECQIKLDPFSRRPVLEFPEGNHDLRRGTIFIRPIGTDTPRAAILRSGEFRNLDVPQATLTIQDYRKKDDAVRFIVKSDAYAHAVHFNLGDDILLSDEYFDLLPGESREIAAYCNDIRREDIKPRSIFSEASK